MRIGWFISAMVLGLGGCGTLDPYGDDVTGAAIDKTPSQIRSSIAGGQQDVWGTTHAEDNEGVLSNVFEQYGAPDNGGEVGQLCWRSITVNGAQSQAGSEMKLVADPQTCTVTSIDFGREAVSRQYDPAELTKLLNERDAQTQETIRAMQDKINAIPGGREKFISEGLLENSKVIDGQRFVPLGSGSGSE